METLKEKYQNHLRTLPDETITQYFQDIKSYKNLKWDQLINTCTDIQTYCLSESNLYNKRLYEIYFRIKTCSNPIILNNLKNWYINLIKKGGLSSKINESIVNFTISLLTCKAKMAPYDKFEYIFGFSCIPYIKQEHRRRMDIPKNKIFEKKMEYLDRCCHYLSEKKINFAQYDWSDNIIRKTHYIHFDKINTLNIKILNLETRYKNFYLQIPTDKREKYGVNRGDPNWYFLISEKIFSYENIRNFSIDTEIFDDYRISSYDSFFEVL